MSETFSPDADTSSPCMTELTMSEFSDAEETPVWMKRLYTSIKQRFVQDLKLLAQAKRRLEKAEGSPTKEKFLQVSFTNEIYADEELLKAFKQHELECQQVGLGIFVAVKREQIKFLEECTQQEMIISKFREQVRKIMDTSRQMSEDMKTTLISKLDSESIRLVNELDQAKLESMVESCVGNSPPSSPSRENDSEYLNLPQQSPTGSPIRNGGEDSSGVSTYSPVNQQHLRAGGPPRPSLYYRRHPPPPRYRWNPATSGPRHPSTPYSSTPYANSSGKGSPHSLSHSHSGIHSSSGTPLPPLSPTPPPHPHHFYYPQNPKMGYPPPASSFNSSPYPPPRNRHSFQYPRPEKTYR